MFKRVVNLAAYQAAASFIRSVPVPARLAAGLQTRQAASIEHLIVIMLLVGLLNTAIVMLILHSDGYNPLTGVWGSGLVLLNGLSFLQHLRAKKFAHRKGFAARKISSVERGAVLHGLFWGALPLMAATAASESQFMAVVTVSAGMMFGGTFLLSRVPVAAIIFVLPIGVGLVTGSVLRGGMTSQLIAILSCVYVFVLVYSVRWVHRQFVQQHLIEATLDEQSQLISMLLRDFGETSSEWFWQTGPDFQLEEVPCDMDTSSAEKSFLQAGRNIFSLFEGGSDRKRLEARLYAHEPFQNVVVRVRASRSNASWVSLTGKPTFIDDVFTGYRGVASDVTQAKLAEDRIAQLAYFDELTGLPNRANLLSQLETWAGAPLAEGSTRAVLCLDLDTFKVINDTLGVHAADQILRQVTNRLTERVLPADVVARLSSDGFAMMIERPAGETLASYLDSLASYLSEPYSVLGASIVCTASIGAAPVGDKNLDAVQFLKRADLAMHEARRKGNGRWASFSQEIADRADARLRGERDLRMALERGELYLVYQPQISAQTQKIVGFEALVRWDHPELGSIPPSEFVPIAEETGQIVQIGEWIIRSAFAEAAKLPRRIRMSVNISPLQMSSDNLLPSIVNALAVNRLAPSRIELEITESVLMSDTTFALQRLRQLRELGVRVSLDDFGTGYSSLSYLRQFPFDKIKIDQSFVRNLETDQGSRAIIHATLNLARLMGMRCTAEGVETLYQASFLKEHGCDDLQGYIAGKPQPMKNFLHLLKPVCGETETACSPSLQASCALEPRPLLASNL